MKLSTLRGTTRYPRLLQALSFGLLATVSTVLSAQTLSLNDSSILRAKTNRIGLNIGAMDYWDNGQILKNLIGAVNPGFEPLIDQQIWVVQTAGTSISFTVPDIYDGVPPNYWAGGTFSVVSVQSGGAELGCSGTITSNTGPNYPAAGVTNWVAPVVTVASPCAAPFSQGDIIVMGKSVFPTPESWWETNQGGFWGNISGGGQLLSDTTDLCATCGSQAINMNATAAGSSASASWYFDTAPGNDIFVLVNGTYQISFWAKVASGSPALTVAAKRFSSGGFNCGTYSPKVTSGWAQYTLTCNASESAGGTVPGNAQVSFQTTGGSIYLDNVSFQKTLTDPTNTTVLRDEVIQTLQKYYGPSIGSNPGMFRFWLSQNAETLSNWTQPDYAHAPTSTGTGYFLGPNGAGTVTLSLEDYLAICQLLNAQPYLEVPVTFSTVDAANLIEFLASPSSTTYGSRRAALGQTNPWTSVFSTIHLSFCNECWNGSSFPGQSLAYRTGTPNAPNTSDPEYYYDYSMRTKAIFAAMRADGYYSQSAFDLSMNTQTAVNYSMDVAIQRARPDSIELEGYTYSTVNDFGSDAALWGPAMIEPYVRAVNPNDPSNFYNAVHDYQGLNTCGASGTAACNVNIYEWGQGTLAGSIDQTHMDYINAGAGEGVVMALQPLLDLQYYGIVNQSNFALTEYQNGAVNGHTAKLWGNVVDMGGATNNVRPTFLAISLVNQSIIGPMYSCPIANNATYTFAGSANNGSPTMPAMNNVPYLYAFCFQNGANRSIVLINTDLSNSHAIAFGGTNTPTGMVTERQFAPSGLNQLNEAPTGSPSNASSAPVTLYTTSLSSPSSLSLPPHSVTALDYTVSTSTTTATPIFTLASGTYTGPLTVSLSDSTSGAAIYYTTNGTTPTTNSTKYVGSITVSASETIQAIAVASGLANSSVASAAYVINTPTAVMPVYSSPSGTYTGTQSVSLSTPTNGSTIYYTTNGATPTTTSAKYAGAITVAASQTIQSFASASGYNNSPVATASYVITTPTAATPVLSLAGGTYTGTQTVTLSDATSGAAIYYTINGTTPTTSSARYSGSITVSASETIEAIAVVSGYNNSNVASAIYQITATSALVPNGVYTLTNRNSGLVVDVPGYSTAQGQGIGQWSSNGGSNQKWALTNLGNNYVELTNVNSGLALEVAGASASPGASVDQLSYNGAAKQIWLLVNAGGGYYELVNQNSGQALEVPGWSGAPGTSLDQWPANGGANQLWLIQ